MRVGLILSMRLTRLMVALNGLKGLIALVDLECLAGLRSEMGLCVPVPGWDRAYPFQ